MIPHCVRVDQKGTHTHAYRKCASLSTVPLSRFWKATNTRSIMRHTERTEQHSQQQLAKPHRHRSSRVPFRGSPSLPSQLTIWEDANTSPPSPRVHGSGSFSSPLRLIIIGADRLRSSIKLCRWGCCCWPYPRVPKSLRRSRAKGNERERKR
uniref:Uncharacterized protein n=1 Tax=Anopheles dirus TaxID=7168 RepID=A0A182NPD0_9DIPT